MITSHSLFQDDRRNLRIAGGIVFIFTIKYLHFLLSPQLWAEDGPLYIQQAWDLGAGSLTVHYAGYYALAIRIVALLTVQLPIAYAALIFSIATFLLHLLPIYLILSNRSNKLFPNHAVRFSLMLVYLIGPGSFEVMGNLTNIQWYLPVWMFVFLFSESSSYKSVTIIEYVLLFVFALTGPYVLFILPIYVGSRLFMQKKLDGIAIALLLICAFIQAWTVYHFPPATNNPVVDYVQLLKFISSKIIFNSLFGMKGQHFLFHGEAVPNIILTVGFIVWLYVSVKILLTKNYFLMALTALGNINFIASFFKSGSFWEWAPNSAGRYVWFSVLAYSYAFYFLGFTEIRKAERYFFFSLMALSFAVGCTTDFKYFNGKNHDWRESIRGYAWASKGDTVLVKTNPENFDLRLVKKADSKIPDTMPTENLILNFMGNIRHDTLHTEEAWVGMTNTNITGGKIYIVLKSQAGSYAFEAKTSPRTDVDTIFRNRATFAGFQRSIPLAGIPSGTYQLGVFAYNYNTYGLRYMVSNLKIDHQTDVVLNSRAETLPRYSIDVFDIKNKHLTLKGWAFLTDVPSEETILSIVAKSHQSKENFVIPTQPDLRADVSDVYWGLYDNCGFSIHYALTNMPSGDYDIFLVLNSPYRKQKIDIQKKITIK